jgi:hypothetical protein
MILGIRPHASTIAGIFVGTLLILAVEAPMARAAAQQNAAPATDGQTTITPGSQPSTAGVITGTVQDKDGEVVLGATVKMTRPTGSAPQTVTSDQNGSFSFSNVTPGTFKIEVSAPGFTSQLLFGTLRPGDTFIVPPVTLPLLAVVTRVVVMPQEEEAQIEVKQEEKQRLLGVVPNFYVTYLPDPAPLTAKQKLQLATKSTFDPITFAITGAVAGIEQGTGYLSGYGPGAEGYAKRYGASYANIAVSTMIGGAVLPSVFRQDPRYFYKGTGSARSRVLYALAFSVICKGDNRKWQVNYSNILGNFAGAGITTLYYPASDRKNTSAATFTVENALIGIAANAATNVLEEFVSKKMTPKSDTADGGGQKPFIVSRLATALIHEGQ